MVTYAEGVPVLVGWDMGEIDPCGLAGWQPRLVGLAHCELPRGRTECERPRGPPRGPVQEGTVLLVQGWGRSLAGDS